MGVPHLQPADRTARSSPALGVHTQLHPSMRGQRSEISDKRSGLPYQISEKDEIQSDLGMWDVAVKISRAVFCHRAGVALPRCGMGGSWPDPYSVMRPLSEVDGASSLPVAVRFPPAAAMVFRLPPSHPWALVAGAAPTSVRAPPLPPPYGPGAFRGCALRGRVVPFPSFVAPCPFPPFFCRRRRW